MIGSEAPFDTYQLLLPTADIFCNHFLYLTVKHGGCGRPPENEVTRPGRRQLSRDPLDLSSETPAQAISMPGPWDAVSSGGGAGTRANLPSGEAIRK
jgi:hypothetical protein